MFPHFSFCVSGVGTAVCLILSWQDCHTQISSQTKFPPISPDQNHQFPENSWMWKCVPPAHGNTLWKAFNSWCFSPWDTEERSLHANVMSIPESYGTSNKIVQAPTTLLSISKEKLQSFTHIISAKLLRALNISWGTNAEQLVPCVLSTDVDVGKYPKLPYSSVRSDENIEPRKVVKYFLL